MRDKFVLPEEEETSVPDIVNEKCNLIYEKIRGEAAQSPRKKIRRSNRLTVICIAAAAAAIISSVPVTAYFVRNGFNFISHEVYTKLPEEQNDLTPYAASVDNRQQEKSADITMQSVYCDGEALALSFMLEPKSQELVTDKCTAISAEIYIKLNGRSIEVGEEGVIRNLNFVRGDDGNFYGVYSNRSLSVKPDTQLDVKLATLKGINGKYRVWEPDDPSDYYASGTYVPQQTGFFRDIFEFSEKISPDTSNNRLYEINETQGNVTLESVLVTPFKTVVNISGLSSKQSLRVLDQDGCRLDFIDWERECQLASPYKTTKQLTVEVFRTDEDDPPAQYSFTFDIEKGFTDKFDVEYDDSDIVYEPPMEVLDAHWEEQQNKYTAKLLEAVSKAEKLPLGTAFEKNMTDYGFESIKTSQSITGSRLVSSADYADKLDPDLNTEDFPGLLLIDYEITNLENTPESIFFCGFDIFSRDMSEIIGTEPTYMPDKDHGGHDGYLYDFKAGETRKITMGYLVGEEYDSFYALEYNKSHASDYLPTAIEKGDCVVMEIE